MRNTFFNNQFRTSEQNLLEDIVIESISVFGQEMLYLPRRRENFDDLTHSDDQSYFDTAYPIEMYIKSIDGFGGDRVFMSKFDIEIRDQIILSISRRRFELEIGTPEEFLAPREGDLIYFPMNGKLFQIMFTDNKPFFYQLGSLQFFDLTCEVFEYSSERFDSGIRAIDSLQTHHTENVLDFGIIDESGNFLVGHSGDMIASTGFQMVKELDNSDNDTIQTEADSSDIINFSNSNPFSERNY